MGILGRLLGALTRVLTHPFTLLVWMHRELVETTVHLVGLHIVTLSRQFVDIFAAYQ